MATTIRPEQLDEGSAEEQQQIQLATQLPASILAVEDLPVLGAGWAKGRMLTWQELEDFRQLFNAKLASNVVISAAARMSRFTQRIILQMLNRLQASKKMTVRNLPAAQQELAAMSHEEFFSLTLGVFREADQILTPAAQIEDEIRQLD